MSKRSAVFFGLAILIFLAVWKIARSTRTTPAHAPRRNVSAIAPSTRTIPSDVQQNGFRLALSGYKYSYPRDHGAHPAFATEWWYYTGHLESTSGEQFGYQLTFFRFALTPSIKKRKSKWATRDLVFAHFAVTDEKNKKFYFDDRIARGALELAGADAIPQNARTRKVSAPFGPRVWLGGWSLKFDNGDSNRQMLRAEGVSRNANTGFAIELQQRALKRPIVHGQNGVSQKSAGRGRASHYYSFTRLQTTGKVRIGDIEYAVRGQSWFDHEFGSNQLAKDQVGWDWFSIQLDDGRELMLYQLRLRDGGIDPFSSGTLIEKNGDAQHLKSNEFRIEVLDSWQSPRSSATYPARWRLIVPRANVNLLVAPVLPDQELDTKTSTGIAYWEGAVRVSGSRDKQEIGRGYVELTGYAQKFDGTF